MFCQCGTLCAYIEVSCGFESGFCVYENPWGWLRFHLCNSSFHKPLVVNINGQNLSAANWDWKVYGIWNILRPQMCLGGGLYKAGQALFNWKRPNCGAGQPHIRANSYILQNRPHTCVRKGHSFGRVPFEWWHTVDNRRLVLIGWLAFDDVSDWLWLAFHDEATFDNGQFWQGYFGHLEPHAFVKAAPPIVRLLSIICSKHHLDLLSTLKPSGPFWMVNIDVVTIFIPRVSQASLGLVLTALENISADASEVSWWKTADASEVS